MGSLRRAPSLLQVWQHRQPIAQQCQPQRRLLQRRLQPPPQLLPACNSQWCP